MTTCLYSFLTAGADRMAQVDPHGWTLTMISVCVVFCALIILFFIYTLSGKIFSGKFKLGAKKKVAGDEADGAVAAAIALAIDAETGATVSTRGVTTGVNAALAAVAAIG